MNRKKSLKYIYLISVYVFYITIMLLNQFHKPTHIQLNIFENDIINLYKNNIDNLYIYISLVGIVLLDAFGIKDIFGFTNFFIILISKQLHTNIIVQIILSILISGFLNAFDKFIRYYYFSTEVQFLLSKPLNLILCFLKFIICRIPYIKEYDISFLTTKYLILISEHNKIEKKHNIIYNFRNNFTRHIYINNFLNYFISISWLSMSEWITPFKELLLYIHNWNCSLPNIIIIIVSEFFDIDNIVEIILITKSFENGTILETRFIMILFNIGFSIIGYIIIFLPTLYWIKKY